MVLIILTPFIIHLFYDLLDMRIYRLLWIQSKIIMIIDGIISAYS